MSIRYQTKIAGPAAECLKPLTLEKDIIWRNVTGHRHSVETSYQLGPTKGQVSNCVAECSAGKLRIQAAPFGTGALGGAYGSSGNRPPKKPSTLAVERDENIFRTLIANAKAEPVVDPSYHFPKDKHAFRGWLESSDTILKAMTHEISDRNEFYLKRIRSLLNALRSHTWQTPKMKAPLVERALEITKRGREMRQLVAAYNKELNAAKNMQRVAERFGMRKDLQKLLETYHKIENLEKASDKLDETIAHFVSLTTPHLPSYRKVADAFHLYKTNLDRIVQTQSLQLELAKINWELSYALRQQALAGSLIGGAIGDALGAPYEFMAAEAIAAIAPEQLVFANAQRGRLKPGQWTDDTQLSLLTLEQILEDEVFIPHKTAHRMLDLYQKKAIRGLGATTAKALTEMTKGNSWKESGQTYEWSAGCGAAMRMSPIALRYYFNSDVMMRNVEMAAQITHRHPDAVNAAKAFAITLQLALKGELIPHKLVDQLIAQLGSQSNLGKKLVEYKSLKDEGWKGQDIIFLLGTGGSGTEIVSTALAAFLEFPEDIEQMIDIAIRSGGDTDSRAAITASIGGAYNGLWDLPPEWIDNVEGSARINQMAITLNEQLSKLL